MGFKPYKYEGVGRAFEWFLLIAGVAMVLATIAFDLVSGFGFCGLLVLFLWSFILGQRNGLILQSIERQFLKNLRAEDEQEVSVSRVVKVTLLASCPLYLSFAFPFMLLPLGGFYAFAFFIPLFAIAWLRMNHFYMSWKCLEIKPNFYWAMQLGICLVMIVASYLIFFLGMGGEVL